MHDSNTRLLWVTDASRSLPHITPSNKRWKFILSEITVRLIVRRKKKIQPEKH
jgi:hypothetical protein